MPAARDALRHPVLRPLRRLRHRFTRASAEARERERRRQEERRELLELIPKGSVGAEVGVWKGEFSALLLARELQRLYLIDPWEHRDDEGYAKAKFARRGQSEMDAIYEGVVRRFAGKPVEILRRRSTEVAQLPALDWAYIDGDHTYSGALADLEHYWPMIKPGGFLCGDDYGVRGWWDDGVTKAVDAFRTTVRCEAAFIRTQFFLTKPLAQDDRPGRGLE